MSGNRIGDGAVKSVVSQISADITSHPIDDATRDRLRQIARSAVEGGADTVTSAQFDALCQQHGVSVEQRPHLLGLWMEEAVRRASPESIDRLVLAHAEWVDRNRGFMERYQLPGSHLDDVPGDNRWPTGLLKNLAGLDSTSSVHPLIASFIDQLLAGQAAAPTEAMLRAFDGQAFGRMEKADLDALVGALPTAQRYAPIQIDDLAAVRRNDYGLAPTTISGTVKDASFDTAMLCSVHGSVHSAPIIDGKFEIHADLLGGDELMLYLRQGRDRAAFVDLVRIAPGGVFVGDPMENITRQS